MAEFAKNSRNLKLNANPTSQQAVEPMGTPQGKSGTGASYNKGFMNSGKDNIGPGGDNEPKKGTGGTNEYAKQFRLAQTLPTTSNIDEAK